jgi:hypothetical protein
MTAPDFIWAAPDAQDWNWGSGIWQASELSGDGDGCTYVRRAPAVIAELPEVKALIARVAELEADMSSGSFYKEADVDWLIKRAEVAEVREAKLRKALESCPPTSNPTLSPLEHLERIRTWWRLTVRPVLQETKP